MKAYLCDSCGESQAVNPAADTLPNDWTRIEVVRNNTHTLTMHLCKSCSLGTYFSVTEKRPFAPRARDELGAPPALPAEKGRS